jgi:hypothetical protein
VLAANQLNSSIPSEIALLTKLRSMCASRFARLSTRARFYYLFFVGL